MTVPSDIAEFFGNYIASFDRLDPACIAHHYGERSTVIDANGRHEFDSRSQVEEKLSHYCAGFKDAGYSQARYECDYYQSMGHDACFVDVRWSITLRDSELTYKTAYTLHRSGASWQIGSAMVYNY